jgi:hypothetical protein
VSYENVFVLLIEQHRQATGSITANGSGGQLQVCLASAYLASLRQSVESYAMTAVSQYEVRVAAFRWRKGLVLLSA